MFYRRRFIAVVVSAMIIIVSVNAFKKTVQVFKTDRSQQQRSEEPQNINKTNIVNPYEVIDYNKLTNYVHDLEKMHPELIKTFSIGKSVEGRELYAVSLGNGDKKSFSRAPSTVVNTLQQIFCYILQTNMRLAMRKIKLLTGIHIGIF